MSGKLSLLFEKADLTRDTDVGGKMDPYIIVKQDKIEAKTTSKNSAGKNPVWNETIVLDKINPTVITIQCRDKDLSTSDLVGESFLSLQSFLEKPGEWQEVKQDLIYQSDFVGAIYYKLKWEPNPGFVLDQDKKTKFYEKVIFSNFKGDLQGKEDSLVDQHFVTKFNQTVIYTSTEQRDTGIHPMFPDIFEYYALENQVLQFQLLDRADGLIGQATLELNKFNQGKSKQQIELKKMDNTLAGNLLFEVDVTIFKLEQQKQQSQQNVVDESIYKTTKLKLSEIKGQFTVDLDTFGKMDPFVVIQIGKQLLKSEVQQNAGKTPNWSKVFEFDVIDEKDIEFEVFDEDNTENELLGKNILPISQLTKQEGLQKDIKLDIMITQKEKQVNRGFITFNAEVKFPPKKPVVQQKVEEVVKKQEVVKKEQPIQQETKKQPEQQKVQQQSIEKKPQIKEPNKNINDTKSKQIFELNKKNTTQNKEKINQPNLSKMNQSINQSKLPGSETQRNVLFGHLELSEFQSVQTLQTSVPSFSIPKADRFRKGNGKVEQTQAVTSDNYIHLPSIFESKNPKGAGFGYGEKNLIPKHVLNNAKYLPGPGSYFQNKIEEQHSFHEKQGMETQLKGYTFGISREFYKKVYIPKMKGNDPEVSKELPGPNQYQRLHEFGKSKQKFTISDKPKERSSKYQTPAANHYDINYDMVQSKRYNGVGFGYGDRVEKKLIESPGPGTYHQEILFGKYQKQPKYQLQSIPHKLLTQSTKQQQQPQQLQPEQKNLVQSQQQQLENKDQQKIN